LEEGRSLGIAQRDFRTLVRDTAAQAVDTAREPIAQFDADRSAILTPGRS
jgi:hypothetical protein